MSVPPPLSVQEHGYVLFIGMVSASVIKNYYRKYQEVKMYADLHIKQKNNEEQAKHCQFFFLLLSHTNWH